MTVCFQEEKEEEKREIEALPPVFSMEFNDNGANDEGSYIYATQNNRNYMNADDDDDDDNDYY